MPVSPGQVFKPLVRLGKSPDDCWQWLGAKNEKGYPIKEINGRTMTAARWLWSQLFGPIPDGLVVSMRCGDPACINPHHMQMMSVTECNQRDRSGLTPQDVAQIRLLFENGAPADKLADRYLVDESTIYRICKRKSWKNVGKARIEEAAAA